MIFFSLLKKTSYNQQQQLNMKKIDAHRVRSYKNKINIIKSSTCSGDIIDVVEEYNVFYLEKTTT